MIARSCATFAACALLASAPVALAAPPAPGTGYGRPLRTIDGLPGIQGAAVADDGTVTVALGPDGVVRIPPGATAANGTRLVGPWPTGKVMDVVTVAFSLTGVPVILDRAAGTYVTITPAEGVFARPLSRDGRLARPVGVAFLPNRALVADGAEPRVLFCHESGEVLRSWAVPAPGPDGLVPLLGGIAVGGGVVAVTDIANNRVVGLDPADGHVVFSKGDRGAFPGLWQSPTGIAWDGSAFVVTDFLNHRVVRIDAAGEVIDQWGQHAVRPREGAGKIHYPVRSAASPDGTTVAVAEPFERRVQLFGHQPPPDPSKPVAPPPPPYDGVSSHFSTSLAVDGKTLLVYEPESASALIFDLRNEPPIHVTTFGGAGRTAGLFGQVTAICVDESRNRCHLADPLRGVIASYALVRDGTAPHYDPFMARLVGEAPLAPIVAACAAARVTHLGAGGMPDRVWPVDLRPTPEGGFVLLDAFGPRIIETDAAFRPQRVFECGVELPGGAGLVLPTQCAVTADRICVVDSADRAVKSYARRDGAFLGAVSLADLRRPFGIAMLPGAPGERRCAVTDSWGDRLCIVRLPADGGAAAVLSTGGATGSKPGQLWEPAAVAWDAAVERIFLTDHGNHRIQSFGPDGSWRSSFGIGRAWVRPKDPQQTAPVAPENRAPSAEGAADTRAQFHDAVRAPDGSWRVRSTDGAWDVQWRFLGGAAGIPPVRNPFDMEVEVRAAADGTPFAGTLRADAAMPQHGHGMNVKPTVRSLGGGRFRVEGMLFHMPGSWELYFDLVRDGVLQRAQGTVTLE